MKVVVIGGGASGLMASYVEALNGNTVILIEKNEKLGKKIYITGKGRCNVTNNCDERSFLNNVVKNSKFLTSSIYNFNSQDLMNLLQTKVDLKTERGNRVFPTSDKSSDIIKALTSLINDVKVDVHLNEKVVDVIQENGCISKVITSESEYVCQKVIIATGGKSYSQTGSTGDGYQFAKKLGHTIVPLKSALVGLNLKGLDFKELQGLSLKNVNLTAKLNGKVIYSEMGEMIFTHFGVSGPLVLTLSSYINDKNLNDIELSIDLKPALTKEILDDRVLRDFALYKGKTIKNALVDLLPKSLISPILERSKINQDKTISVITSEERKRLVSTLKSYTFLVASLRPLEEAIVTSGGVNVKEINPKNMESKLVKGLFFAGEVIDCDALTGGYNLQIAFSTGYLAGSED